MLTPSALSCRCNVPRRQIPGLLAALSDTDDDRFAADAKAGLALTLMSFGFKYGVPSNADLVFDVRFLHNPYYVDALRPKTGRDPAVQAQLAEGAPEVKLLYPDDLPFADKIATIALD